MPTAAQQYAEIIKQAFFYNVKKLLISKLVASFPLFGVGLFNPILSFFVGKIVKILAEDAKLLVYFQYIDMRVSAQATEYEQAAKDYSKAVEGGDQNEINRCEKILDVKFDTFVKWSAV